jgi:hypothetical protein
MPDIDFSRIRSGPKSKNDCFEALATQLFRASCPAPNGATFYNVRGDGGDGGVEAYFQAPDGAVLGVQAKYFFKLESAELQQIKDSLKTALLNHPSLAEYWVYVPFDLTGRKSGGARGKSQIERFDQWKVEVEGNARAKGGALTIVLCGASTIREQLQSVDPHGGARRYWFDDSVLTLTNVESCLDQAKAFAGPRYKSAIDVFTTAHHALDFFGGIGNLADWTRQVLNPLLRNARLLSKRAKEAFSELNPADCLNAETLFQEVLAALKAPILDAGLTFWVMGTRASLSRLGPLVIDAERLQLAAFVAEHGEDKDNPGFRQFQAEYMCAFPAGNLDTARDLLALVDALEEALASAAIQASSTQSLLLVGPAGTGKTHALVSAAERRLRLGGFSLVVFGDDFGHSEPWEVLRTKLGFGSDMKRETLFETLQACAENTGLPFVVAIDALNESPKAARWKDKLPELLEQCKKYPGIRVCVSTRDTYRDLIVDARFPGFAFEHQGFAGREFEALHAFATYYGLDAEITPLFADELRNPLFLHLACSTMKEQGCHSLDVSLPGFTALFEGHLDSCDKAVRSRLGYNNPRNVVRAAMLGLSATLVRSDRTWDNCAAAIRPVIGAEATAEALLHELQHEGLIIVTGSEAKGFIVRLSYQRYGDVLRAVSLVDNAMDANGQLDIVALAAALTALGDEDRGLLEVLAAILPEKTGVELTEPGLGLPVIAAQSLFVKALTWRSRESIPTGIHAYIRTALFTPELWPEVYEVFFKLSLVPNHRLNARQWLHSFLSNSALANRDAFLSKAAVQSYDGGKAVRSLISSALRADISIWPEESRELATVTLGWLASCADRRVRDQATKGLMRIFRQQPSLGTSTLACFSECDDDYILESVCLAVYGALLLDNSRATDFTAAFEMAMTSGYDVPNVLITDTVRSLGLELRAANALPRHLELSLSRYPTKVTAPTPWPTKKDAQPLLGIAKLPLNMRLLGGSLAPDFWRYIVEPRLRAFDLGSAGVSLENVASWIMTQTLSLGYPGENNVARNYDRGISSQYGPGRGRAGFAERLGKKYYWIALHRLIGVLADNVPAMVEYDGSRPPPETLWSVDLRKSDPTDVRDISPALEYPDSILEGSRYQFPSRGGDIKNWVNADDFTPHGECILRRDTDGVEWVLLSLSVEDDDRSDEERQDWDVRHLGVSLYYTSALIARSKRLTQTALEGAFNDDSPACYKSYLAEYPKGAGFRQCLRGKNISLGPSGVEFTDVHLVRGSEWKYDFSSESEAEGLHVPCPKLVEGLQLRWDQQRGWIAAVGQLVAFEAKLESRKGLAIRRDMLNEFLSRDAKRLIFKRFINRGFFVGSGTDGSQLDRQTYLRYEHDGSPAVLAEISDAFNC